MKLLSLDVGATPVDFEQLAARIQPPEGLLRDQWDQHWNRRDKTVGGWVQNTAEVADSAYVAPGAIVMDSAKIRDHAEILDSALICGWAVVCGRAVVSGCAVVTDEAEIGGNCHLTGSVIVAGHMHLQSETFSKGVVRPSSVNGKSKNEALAP